VEETIRSRKYDKSKGLASARLSLPSLKQES
jgi:hypothetical protein